MAELICPKCGSAMRTYERNGVTVDQCTGCGGLFLDRGELERLIEAEGAHYAGAADPARGDHREGNSGYGRRRRGFLGGLFEGDD